MWLVKTTNRGNTYTSLFEKGISEEKLSKIISETMAKSDYIGSRRGADIYTHSLNKYGYDEVKMFVENGEVTSLFPVSGNSVRLINHIR